MPKYLVIFDLDNTLIVTKPAAKDAYKNAINYIAKQHGIYNQRFKLYNHWKKIVQKLSLSKDPYKREFEYSLRQLLSTKSIPDTYISQALSIFEKDFLNKLKLQRGAKELLSWLKQNGHAVSVSTESMHSLAKKKLKAVGVLRSIDILITPNDVGQMKPDAKYYQLAIKESKTPLDYCIAVGDSQSSDIDPAVELGIHGILVPSSNFHLSQIKPKLESIFSS